MSDKKRANEDASDGVAKKAKGDKQAFEKLFDQSVPVELHYVCC